ncbi:MAG: nitrogen fixation protein NifQ [Magnetovibrionaceae bacterium]
MAAAVTITGDRLAVRAKALSRGSGDTNEGALARMVASWAGGTSALPRLMGLTPANFRIFLKHQFPGLKLPAGQSRSAVMDADRDWEREDLMRLLMRYRARRSASERWVAAMIVAACMGSDHLWHDLGLWSRAELTQLMRHNFPRLAARNNKNMRWKKFLYKQLCEEEGLYICRSPSCEVCVEYAKCFIDT